jgi:hypothetical protein
MMGKPLSILCVHGVGHGEADPNLQPSWSDAISRGLQAWDPAIAVSVNFLRYDALFEREPPDAAAYGEAMAKILASSVLHGVGDLFTRRRALFNLPDQIRWTAGMVGQWVSDDKLRKDLRDTVLDELRAKRYDVVCAHSLGSLICYDTFTRNPKAAAGLDFVSFGSQIGNPGVRDIFAGRIVPLGATMWFHLFNPDDHVFTAPITLDAPNFSEVATPFDIPNDILNHDAVHYLSHTNTVASVWRTFSGVPTPGAVGRGLQAFRTLATKPERRALLVGINDYPDPANRLEGCVNDVFLVSSVLQECGFKAAEIRVILNERATASAIRDRLQWLLDDVADASERVLFYSGHGAQLPDYGATDEVDHLDECLVPYDFDWSPQHAFTDKEFYNLYSQLPYGSKFAIIFDCCYSGGMTRDGALRVRGLAPPDDIRHRGLSWDEPRQSWVERTFESPSPGVGAWQQGDAYLSASGATNRLGRAMNLRTLSDADYDRTRQALKHRGPYLPLILEACSERQFAYEYRHGATSYGAFTYSLAQILRSQRQAERNPTFAELVKQVGNRLKELNYDQSPSLVGPKAVITAPVPWLQAAKGPRPKGKRGTTKKRRK